MPKENALAVANQDLSALAPSSNAFKKLDLNGIKFINNTSVEWRANMEKSVGEFLMFDQKKGPELEMRILNYREEENVYFSDQTGEEAVIQVVFIAPNNAVGSIYFRTHSIANFKRLITSIQLEGALVASKIVTAKMAKKTTNGNTYHIVEFSARNNTPEGFTEIAEFVTNVAPEAIDAFRESPKKPVDK